ncbi:type I glutamate--ammonia ligase [Haematospirillum sp. 15-248]|uniref:type I glutamate--ammonia ligase n=1 Tax=Haematospirillum sp. 15-248 TaxID=2723107 RepID=UPI00143B5C97|nr:type I glutamate--ammonia ligase [Haematospirillum sp. 15-248]NKD88613.1 type I glutamate--ammonia ligase [Haematospirillum sp. 15-248]
MSDTATFFEKIKENDVKYVDFRFTDPRGKWQHTAQHVKTVTDDLLADGIMFDGSSIAGWKEINESDMILMPDISTAIMDPFTAQPQLVVFCDVVDPATGQSYDRCPRGIARRGLAYAQSTGIADTAYFGPEAEFFVFDDVRYTVDMNKVSFELDAGDAPWASGKEFDQGNWAHRPGIKGGYFPVPPVDSGVDLRAEMTSTLLDMGVDVEKHHHEVASSQHELGFRFGTLLQSADWMQIYKYVVHMVAHSYGKTATFMPKPLAGDNGSGMHVHQSLWKDGKPLFAGSGYADLSDMALYYIGGIIKHAKALNAFTNPSTNSYKRLIPGFEAPVLLAYSSRNRSASCRIPYVSNPKGKRVEVRFPDPTANPYLAYTAMMMAGLDGIQNKIHPGDPMDKNLYDLPPEELSQVPTVCGSLREALDALKADRDFLMKGDVFTPGFLDAYTDLKFQEVHAFEHTPHPIEYQMYYSA